MLTAIFALALLTATAASAGRKELTVEEQYELGLKYLRRESYVKALEQFNRIRNTHRDDPYSVKAELAIGDVYYKKREWDQARLAYEDFMRMHPRHPDLDYVVYRMGLSLYRKAPLAAGRDQTWTRQAVHTWAGFEGRFPESEYRTEVEEFLEVSRNRLAKKELDIARFYVRRKAWGAVSNRAEGMLRTYPDSRHVSDALFLDGIAASYGQPDVLVWVRGRLEAKDPERLAKLDRKSARIMKREARKDDRQVAERKEPVAPAPAPALVPGFDEVFPKSPDTLTVPGAPATAPVAPGPPVPPDGMPNDPSGNPDNMAVPGGAPPTSTLPEPAPAPAQESTDASDDTTDPAPTP
jgi:outer membrane protein assembly factor BamD